jgi:hypothetical protein
MLKTLGHLAIPNLYLCLFSLYKSCTIHWLAGVMQTIWIGRLKYKYENYCRAQEINHSSGHTFQSFVYTYRCKTRDLPSNQTQGDRNRRIETAEDSVSNTSDRKSVGYTKQSVQGNTQLPQQNVVLLWRSLSLTSQTANYSALQFQEALFTSLLHLLTSVYPAMALQPGVGPWPPLQFRNIFYTVDRTPRTSDQPVARPLPTHRTTQTQNKRTQSSVPWVGFEPTIPAFEGAKTVHT